MAYRPQWFAEIAGDRSVLEIALDVHMTVTGAMDRQDEAQEKDIMALRHVVRQWKPSVHSLLFDGAVRQVVVYALDEAAAKADAGGVKEGAGQ